jgi:hypothetical protein
MPSTKKVSAVLILCLSFLVLAACSKGYDQKTGSYDDNGITVNLPPGWTKTTTVPYATLTIATADQNTHMSLFIQKMPDTVTLDDFLKKVSASQAQLGAQEFSSGTITMGDLEGQWFVRTITVGGVSFTSITYTVMRDATAYSIMGISKTDAFGQWEQTFDRAAKSLRFH